MKIGQNEREKRAKHDRKTSNSTEKEKTLRREKRVKYDRQTSNTAEKLKQLTI